MSSVAVYGVMLAGWSSGSKYPLLGSVRASAQMVSYEAALGLSVVSVVLITGSLRTHQIVAEQAQGIAHWTILAAGVVPFIVFLLAGTAEIERPPFDLLEAEQELVAGFNTEYSGIRFALFYLASFMNTITTSAIIVTLFLGGPDRPGARRTSVALVVLLVLREADRVPVHVRVVPRDAAALPLRPAHGPRMEGADPGVARMAARGRRHPHRLRPQLQLRTGAARRARRRGRPRRGRAPADRGDAHRATPATSSRSERT